MAPDLSDLSAYIDGELSETDRRAVEDRLAADSEYAREYERLERTRTMLALAIEQPSFHARLVKRIDARRGGVRAGRLSGRRFLAAGVAAAVVMTVAAILFMSLTGGPVGNGPSPGPRNLAATPVAVQSAAEPATSGDHEPLASAEESATSEATSSTPLEETKLPFTLGGTITGSSPLAIISVESGGVSKSGTYAPGDTIAEGVTLVSVESGKVVLDYNGQNVELTQTESSGTTAGLNGEWTLVLLRSRSAQGMPDETLAKEGVTVKQQGSKITATMNEDLIEGTLSGNTVRATITPKEGDVFEVAGVFDKDWTVCTGIMPAEIMGYPDGYPNGESITFRMARVPADQVASQKLFNDRINEVREMAKVLLAYANQNGGVCPPRLEDLVPGYVPNLAIFADRDDRRVQYTYIKPLRMADYPKFEDTNAGLPLPDRLVQWEQSLKAAGMGEALLSKPMLAVDYTNPEARFRATKSGVVALDNQTSQALADMRATCQNNLKQLGLVIKMFENEHDGYIPAGWLSCYPEYLTDPNVLTSPKDEPGTDSYLYLLPAVHLESYVQEAFPDLFTDGNPAGRAKAMSEIPVATNRTDFGGDAPGRNVLFADGHVEYLRTDVWRERVLPFVQRMGN